jgi:hypothetical protein
MELAANKIFRTVSANPANYAEGNYEIYGELRVEKTPNSGLFEKTLSARLLPDLDDNATFELQDGASDFFPLPDFDPASVNTIQPCDDNQVNAQFFAAESYGDPAEMQALTLRSSFRILNGGLPKIYNGDFFGTFLPETKSWLTWHPGNKRVNQNQPELLHFYVPAGVSTITQRIEVFFTDGTSQVLDVETAVAVITDRIYRIPTGYHQLALQEIDPEKTIAKYNTWLVDQSNNIIASPFMYIVEPVPASNARYWMFTNSLGMWEIMRAEGKTAEDLDVERQVASTYLPQGYDRFDGELQSRVIGSAGVLSVNTGYFDSKEESLWANEIMLSNKVVLLDGSLRLPYIITTNSRPVYQDKTYNWALNFEARLAFNDTKYATL